MEFFCVPSSKPVEKITMAFGQDVLKYTLPAFRTYLENVLNTEAKKWTYSRKSFFLKLLPKLLHFKKD